MFNYTNTNMYDVIVNIFMCVWNKIFYNRINFDKKLQFQQS